AGATCCATTILGCTLPKALNAGLSRARPNCVKCSRTCSGSHCRTPRNSTWYLSARSRPRQRRGEFGGTSIRSLARVFSGCRIESRNEIRLTSDFNRSRYESSRNSDAALGLLLANFCGPTGHAATPEGVVGEENRNRDCRPPIRGGGDGEVASR